MLVLLDWSIYRILDFAKTMTTKNYTIPAIDLNIPWLLLAHKGALSVYVQFPYVVIIFLYVYFLAFSPQKRAAIWTRGEGSTCQQGCSEERWNKRSSAITWEITSSGRRGCQQSPKYARKITSENRPIHRSYPTKWSSASINWHRRIDS